MRHIVAALLILTLCAPLVHTIPTREEEENPTQWTYVPSPRTRGTWTILSTCFTALLASTWSGLHLNIPKQKQDTGQSWKDWSKKTMRDSAFPIKWALAAIIAPESLVGFAFSDWMHARKTEALTRKYGRGTVQSWDQTQVYFANMGGFVFRNFEVLAVDSKIYDQKYPEEIRAELLEIQQEFNEHGLMRLFKAMRRMFAFVSFSFQAAINKIATRYRNSKKMRLDASNEPHSTETHPAINLHAIQGREEVETDAAGLFEPSSHAGSDQNEEHTPSTSHATPAPRLYDHVPTKRIDLYLNGTQILLAQRFGIIQDAPEMSTREIEDKSKNTPFTKIFLTLPLVVLAYIVIYRAINGLLVSQLELSVAAYSVCTILASACYWSKPQSVGVPKIISTGQLRPLLFHDQQILSAYSGTSFLQTNFYPPFGADRNLYLRGITRPISNDNIVGAFCRIGGPVLHNADFASVISGTLFGTVYCLCWNSPFPSTIEKYLWRTASVFVTAGLIPYALANAYFTRKYSATKTHTDIRQKIVLYTLLVCYIMARLFLFGKCFGRCFISLRGRSGINQVCRWHRASCQIWRGGQLTGGTR